MHDYQAIFDAITRDPRYLANLDWGEPRSGHPEGTIRAHIADLEQNLARLRDRLSESDYWKLKLLIHTHDSFKATAQPGVAITHPQSHASLARAFLAEYCDDPDLLAMIQNHDVSFALWRQLQHTGRYKEERLTKLLEAIADWNLFLAFLLIDGSTLGKSRDPLRWFFKEVEGKVSSTFNVDDIRD